jgi:hypothetical protein
MISVYCFLLRRGSFVNLAMHTAGFYWGLRFCSVGCALSCISMGPTAAALLFIAFLSNKKGTAPPLPFGLQGWGVDCRLPITVSRGGSTSFERFSGAITSDYQCGIRLFHLHMRTSNRLWRSVGGLRKKVLTKRTWERGLCPRGYAVSKPLTWLLAPAGGYLSD